MAGKTRSIKGQLAARVAESAGIERGRAEIILRSFYEEALRAAGEDGEVRLPRLGRLLRIGSLHGRRCPRTGCDLGARWSWAFTPFWPMVRRYLEICTVRNHDGAGRVPQAETGTYPRERLARSG